MDKKKKTNRNKMANMSGSYESHSIVMARILVSQQGAPIINRHTLCLVQSTHES